MTSRVPIDADDLARRAEELVEGGGAGAGLHPAATRNKEELMHFRIHAAGPGQQLGSTMGMGASVSNATQHMPGASPSGAAPAATAALAASTRPSNRASADTFVESKTTGEFIRVRPSQAAQLDGDMAAEQVRARAYAEAHANKHNIADFDASIDGIIDSVNSIQAGLSAFWLCVTGLLVGACLLQVYVVYIRSSDVDFVSFYSRFAGPARKVIYVLSGFSASLATWRLSLERLDPDRHPHFIARYHAPNSHGLAWWRNWITSGCLLLAFLLTVIMVPLEDFLETKWEENPSWILTEDPLPSFFTDKIDDWYRMCMARLLFVAAAWLGLIARYAGAEFHFLELQQEKSERRLLIAPNTASSAMAAAPSPLGATQGTTAGGIPSRTAAGSYGGGAGAHEASSGVTARHSSRLSSSQRATTGGTAAATGNAASQRFDTQPQQLQMTNMRR
jgi:hypothetical protein